MCGTRGLYLAGSSPSDGIVPSAINSRNCSWRMTSLLSGIRYFRTSANAYATRAWASAGGANADISTCKSSFKWAYFGSKAARKSSSWANCGQFYWMFSFEIELKWNERMNALISVNEANKSKISTSNVLNIQCIIVPCKRSNTNAIQWWIGIVIWIEAEMYVLFCGPSSIHDPTPPFYTLSPLAVFSLNYPLARAVYQQNWTGFRCNRIIFFAFSTWRGCISECAEKREFFFWRNEREKKPD